MVKQFTIYIYIYNVNKFAHFLLVGKTREFLYDGLFCEDVTMKENATTPKRLQLQCNRAIVIASDCAPYIVLYAGDQNFAE